MRRDDVTGGNGQPAAGRPAAQLDGNSDQLSWSIDNLAGIQAADRDIAPILKWLKSGRQKPGVQELKPYSPVKKAYCAQWNNLKLENGVVYRQYFREGEKVGLLQLLVSYQMRDQLMQEIHCNVTGHLDANKTRVQVQKRAYWYGWAKDVEIFCRACAPCNQYFRGRPRDTEGCRTCGRVPQWRGSMSISLVHSQGHKSGMIYICTRICAFTRYAIAVPIPDKSAITVARALIDNVFLKVGCPETLLTDNGKEFENALFRQLCRGLDILMSRTTMYQSRSNGCVERWHRSLNSMLGKVVQTHQTDWPSHVPFVVNAYNTTVHSSVMTHVLW